MNGFSLNSLNLTIKSWDDTKEKNAPQQNGLFDLLPDIASMQCQ